MNVFRLGLLKKHYQTSVKGRRHLKEISHPRDMQMPIIQYSTDLQIYCLLTVWVSAQSPAKMSGYFLWRLLKPWRWLGGQTIRNNRRWGDNSQKEIPARETYQKKFCKRWYVEKNLAEKATCTGLRLLKVWDKGEKDNCIKQCLKMKIIEIPNLDFVSFCLLCFFKRPFKRLSLQGFSYCPFSSVQCSIKYNVLYEWS